MCSELFSEGSEDLHMEEKLSKHLKENFENTYGGVWHCIVGTRLGYLFSLPIYGKQF